MLDEAMTEITARDLPMASPPLTAADVQAFRINKRAQLHDGIMQDIAAPEAAGPSTASQPQAGNSPPLQEDVPRKSPRLNPVSGTSGGGSNVGDGGDDLDEVMTLTLTLSLRLTLNAN